MSKYEHVTTSAPVPKPTAPAPLELIAVKTLWFHSPISIPGASVPSGLSSTPLTPETRNRQRHEIEFSPKWAQYKITFYPLGGEPPKIVWVPRERVASWEPL